MNGSIIPITSNVLIVSPQKKIGAMESLITGYLRSVHCTEETSFHIPPVVHPNGYAEPSLVTGLASTIWG